MNYVTLAEDNAFSFTCPIFNSETRMSSCVKLRELIWKGKQVEKRKGCQACMAAGKCPAAHIVQKISISGMRNPQPDDYGSLQPVKGKLRKEVLERIRPVMVTSSAIQRCSPSAAEIELIETANERIDAMIGTAPGASTKRSAMLDSGPQTSRKGAAKKTRAKAKIESPEQDKIEQAAASGDLSAAI